MGLVNTYPVLYDKTDKDYTGMGRGLLTDCISAIVTEERNGAFYLEMEYPSTAELSPYIVKEATISCNASQNQRDQRFIIKSIVNNGITMSIYAEHYSYKANDNQIIAGARIQDRSGVYAMDAWKRWLVAPHDFETYSDIGDVRSAVFDVDVFETAKEVLAGTEGSILDVWGGEFKFDNNKISLLKKRGQERTIPIAYGRNLKSHEQEESIENTKTAIYPYAKYQNKDKDGNVIENSFHYVTLPEKYLDSDNASKFEHRIIEKVDFSQEVLRYDKDDNPLELTVNELRGLAIQYMKQNNFGVPHINIKIPFIDLGGYTVALEENSLEPLELCDIVPVWLPKQDIQLSAKIIETEWDVIQNTYKSLTLGDAKDDLRVLFNYSQYSVINQALAKASKDLTATFSTWYNDIRVDVDNATSSLSGVEDDLGNIKTNISNLSTVADSIDNRVGGLTNEVSSLQATIETLSDSYSNILTIVNGHTESIVDLETRVEALESSSGSGGTAVDAYTKIQSDNRYSRKDLTLSSSTSLNNIYDVGFYSVRSASNLPSSASSYGTLIVSRADLTTDMSATRETDSVQLYIDSNNEVFVRNSIDRNSGVWTIWRKILTEKDLSDPVQTYQYNGVLMSATRVNNLVTITVNEGSSTDAIYDERLPSEFRPTNTRRSSVAYHNSSTAMAIWCFRITSSGWVYCDFTTLENGGYIKTNRTGGTIQNSVSFSYRL